MYSKISILLLFVIIVSCQPVELISPLELDNSKLEKISINAKDVNIQVKYNPIFSEENIEDQLINTPVKILKSWINSNIINYGNQNYLLINVYDSSILKKEIENKNSKKYEEKTIFQYEVFFLVEYELYDNSDYLLASTTVEVSRSTTSQKYVSLNETEIIINDLIIKALKDFIDETQSMTKLYMSEYL